MKTGFTYVMSDIHGNAERFNSIINQIELKPEDSLYVLGDVIDRYPDGIRILRLLMSLPNVKLLLGNHEYMMLEALDYHADSPPDPWDPWGKSKYIRVWYANGGEVTHEYLKHLRKTVRAEIFEYLKSLPLNIEIEVGGIQYLLVHGGIVHHILQPDSTYEAVWQRIKSSDKMPEGKTVIFGHTPTLHYQNEVPMRIWHGTHMIGIDCGSGSGFPGEGRLACLRLDDMKEFYSES